MLPFLFLLAAAASADARLVCSADEKLVVVAPDTFARKPFRAAPRALGQAEAGVPPGLSGKAGAPKELAFNEPSPWGGRLVAPSEAEGDLPSGPLVHVGKDGKSRPLTFEGKKLDFKGAA